MGGGSLSFLYGEGGDAYDSIRVFVNHAHIWSIDSGCTVRKTKITTLEPD